MSPRLIDFIAASNFHAHKENYEFTWTGFANNFERLESLIRSDQTKRLQAKHEREIASIKNERINKNRVKQITWNIYEYAEAIEELAKTYEVTE